MFVFFVRPKCLLLLTLFFGVFSFTSNVLADTQPNQDPLVAVCSLAAREAPVYGAVPVVIETDLRVIPLESNPTKNEVIESCQALAIEMGLNGNCWDMGSRTGYVLLPRRISYKIKWMERFGEWSDIPEVKGSITVDPNDYDGISDKCDRLSDDK